MNWQDPVQHAPSGGNPVSPPKVTIRDVARESGLSVASVSRALSGSRPVTPAVARVVDDVASRLGYRPDHVAQSLSTGRTATVGLVLPDISSPFFPALAGAIEKTLRMSGLTMLLMSTENDPEWERKCVADLIARRIDGLLISPTHRFRQPADDRRRNGQDSSCASRPLRECTCPQGCHRCNGHSPACPPAHVPAGISAVRLRGCEIIRFVSLGEKPRVPATNSIHRSSGCRAHGDRRIYRRLWPEIRRVRLCTLARRRRRCLRQRPHRAGFHPGGHRARP